MKKPTTILFALGFILMLSCNKEDLFEQPDIELTGYKLLELPGEYTHLEIDMKVYNNDHREAEIKDVEYTAIIEGYTTEKENLNINKKILVGTPLELTLPMTLVTNDAIQLLKKLDAGEELDYIVTGTFHVDSPVLNLFDWPINIEGTAIVDAGFDDFYKQPEVTVNDISGTYSINGFISYTFDLDVNSTIENKDNRSATIDEVEYFVIIGGVKSETHHYSDTYPNVLMIEGAEIQSLSLPVTLNLDPIEGAALVAEMADGTIDYTIEGTFHTIEVEGAPTDFLLPLYITGNTPSSLVGK